ncbi:SDR family NAD(P)-dependent oxidoreductase [Flavobacteriaceae bacterium S356]|uniref:SDR family NAD(P)-dependent oxidoreductase n=1 Tax=Asprobacillus argus TaxID=3076534 RepID=A0ABU3LB43_9FLAO|nr:SDR family NAD(P)-dependent oxidoreductase [Flavobacteriaceae bacterium S356]
MEDQEENKDKIAIVGIDCRLPGANNAQEFWENLVKEKESLVEFTEEELKEAGVSPKTYNNPNYVRRRGVVRDAEMFDAEFFNFTPREAELLDPQHRLFLECAWHALEDGGIDPFNTDKKVAVFGGTGSPYHLLDTIENESVLKYANGTSIITSNDKDYVTTRVSYKLNLKGPSINVQSACSTSMVGVVMGIDSLLSYQSDVVLAGGATVELPVTKGYTYQEGSLESPDGKCRTFDKDAQGTVFSRGCGVVALKRLEDAIEDKDHIYAVVLGGAINNDGNRKAGYTAPSVQGQVEVITEALEFSGISPRSISMVEAHGTATPVGDPIEVSSLTEAFSQYTDDKQYCALGSVKTNIGHTDVASGVASLIKTSLSLKHGIIPASLNYNESNPAINFNESPFFVNTKTKQWEKNGVPRRALINSFGVGGTNACVILEEPPQLKKAEEKEQYDSLFLSAHSKNSFENYCKEVKAYLEEHPDTNLSQFAHTSRVARKPMKYKAVFPFKEYTDLLQSLEKSSPLRQATLASKDLVFMFPGQGNQFINMGRELYENIPDFKECIDYCATTLQAIIGIDIRTIIFPSDEDQEKSKEQIDHTYITQPAIFMISYALANTLQNYGVKPEKLIGHSVGEYVAAAIAGIMSLEDALKSVAIRGKLVFDLPQGSMLAVLMSEEELLKILPKELCVAVINSPELVVVSGETQHIEAFAKKLKEDKVFNKLLPTSHAFHSTMMEPCLEEYANFFKTVSLHVPKIPVISTVTGKVLTDEEAQSQEYWINHVVDPVRFGDAASQVLENESAVFFECGPGQSLESAVKRRITKEMKHAVISTLQDKTDAVISMDYALGKLWMENIPVDFDTRYDSSAYDKMPFPLLPFNRKSYLVDFSAKSSNMALGENTKSPMVEDWYFVPSWKKTSAIDFLPKIEKEAVSTIDKWLIFIDGELSKSIVEKLQDQGKTYYTVQQGSSFDQDGNMFTINPAKKEDYERLFEAINEENIGLKVVYTWSFSENDNLISLENAAEELNTNFYNLLYLEKGIITNNIIENVRVVSLINDGFDVVGTGNARPEKTLAIGPMKVLFKEHLGISTQLINITATTPNNVSKLADQIVKEVNSETDENIISYSGLNRWTQTFEQIRVPNDGDTKLLKDNGVYIITGGSGGIGRVLSELIAKKVQGATIVWTGRKAFPDRKDWGALLMDDNTDSVLKEKIKTIQKVEELGSKVAYYSVGVLDFEKMRQTFDAVEEKYGAINGVIHSAGVAGGGVVASIDKERIAPVIEPKVQGTLILKELLKDRDVDFIYLFSSITAILGEVGRVDYIAANSFMDACANAPGWLHDKAAVSSINWGQWGLVGMAADWRMETLKNKNNQSGHKVIGHSSENYPIELSFSHKTENESCHQIHIDIDKHWIFKEHLLTSIPTMVGTSYIETLIKWKEKEGITGDLTLKNTTFLSPLMIMPNMLRDLYLFCDQKSDGHYTFTFKSITSGSSVTDQSGWQDHFTGEVIFKEHKDLEKIDVDALLNAMLKEDDSPHKLVITDGNNKPTLQYSKRWDCKEKIHIGEGEWLTKMSLNDEFKDDFSYFFLHPAMMDVATSAHFGYMDDVKSSYLPFSYGAVNIYAPFKQEFYAYAKVSEEQPKENHLSFDFQLFDVEGQLIADVLDYSFVKLADVSENNTTKESTEEVVLEALEDDILPNEGEEVLETMLCNDNLPQVIIYVKDLLRDMDDSRHSVLIKKRKEKITSAKKVADVDDRPDIDTPYVKPENEIEVTIAAVWTAILGINKIGLNDAFNSLGGNSLLAIQVVSGIKDEFDVAISTDEFVNNPTVFKLGELVLEKILGEHSTEDLEKLLNE